MRRGSTYDDGYDPITIFHRRFVDRLIETTPEGGTLLDAPCGTGPYFDMILAAGRQVVGADQSAGDARAGEDETPRRAARARRPAGAVVRRRIRRRDVRRRDGTCAAGRVAARPHQLATSDSAGRAPLPDRRTGRSEPPGGRVRRGDLGRAPRRLRGSRRTTRPVGTTTTPAGSRSVTGSTTPSWWSPTRATRSSTAMATTISSCEWGIVDRPTGRMIRKEAASVRIGERLGAAADRLTIEYVSPS